MPITWKHIPDHPLYDASDTGEVRSHWAADPHTLKPYRYHRNLYVTLVDEDGTHTQRAIHALVASAHLGPRPEGRVIRHINGNLDDNSAANLEYVTRSQLAKDSTKKARRAKATCKNGHRYTAGTTYHRKDGTRECRICRAEQRLARGGRTAALVDLGDTPATAPAPTLPAFRNPRNTGTTKKEAR